MSWDGQYPHDEMKPHVFRISMVDGNYYIVKYHTKDIDPPGQWISFNAAIDDTHITFVIKNICTLELLK